VILALLLAVQTRTLPLPNLRFGMSRADAERAAGERKSCRQYGDHEVGGFCFVMLFQNDTLDEIAMIFDSVDEAHAKLTHAWGAPIAVRDRELWLGESLQAWLFPYVGHARLEFRGYRPFAKLLGKNLTLDGKKVLGMRRADIRSAFGARASCKDQDDFCNVFLAPTEYGEGALSLYLEFEKERISSVMFTVAAADSRQVLKAAERVWGRAVVDYNGMVKDVIHFAGEPRAHAEAMEHTVIFCFGKCP
jgi:hypothetical protein